MAILFDPRFQAVDANGLPMSGATLAFYIAGTTSKITIYQDSGATAPHTNLVVADASGTFPAIFIATEEDFKYVLKDAAGVTVATVNGMPAIPSTVADGVVTPAKLSTGGPSWNTDGDLEVLGGIEVSGDAEVTGDLSMPALATGRALVVDSEGKIAESPVTETELGYLDGVTGSLVGAMKFHSSVPVTMTGKAAANGGKWWDVPAKTRRILFRATNLTMNHVGSWGSRFYTANDGLISAGYGGYHTKITTGSPPEISISDSSSFLTLGGFSSTSEQYNGSFELYRGNDPNHAWMLLPTLIVSTPAGNSMRQATGGRFLTSPVNEFIFTVDRTLCSPPTR